MEDSPQNAKTNTCSNQNKSNENNKVKQNSLTKDKMNYERFNLENDGSTEYQDKNWSWKEQGNDQYKVCNAPDSSLPELSPYNTTPLNQKNIGCITEILLSDSNSKLNKEIDTFVEKEIDKDVDASHGKKQGDYIEFEDGTAYLVG
ncbi:24928_t:CDS:2 [Cetraspora pellucida]|uniref:24928_t:CDS:1 n=1 Tax=Cetraspora pellucida TaxID=1433469 RepID=A0A9N9JAA0_9GLOM|nr:24928_t:CDS:2 [Cetraspora pellucida]